MASQTEIDIIKGRACDNCGKPWGYCLCDMDLPPGKTCGECINWKRCKSLIDDLEATNLRCDFAPSRFVLMPPPCAG